MQLTGSSASETHWRVLELVARGYADQDALAANLSAEERAARGELHAWSAKDHVAHNNFWRQDAIRRLQAALDGTTPPNTEADQDTWNDRTFQEQRDTPWEALVAETERLRAETVALVQRLSPDDLADPRRFPWQDGVPLEILILVNWYDHPAEHWADFYVNRGELDRAFALRQAVAATVRELLPHHPIMYSYMVYKLGIVYALHGRADQAIESLREALDVNPAFITFVQQDADLDSLRALPAFRALVDA